MVDDAVWAQAGDAQGWLCIGCLEERLGRGLTPDDFPPIPSNDDNRIDTVRLRNAKGSGRATEPLYMLAVDAVLDLGADPELAARRLDLDLAMLKLWIENTRFNAAVGAAVVNPRPQRHERTTT